MVATLIQKADTMVASGAHIIAVDLFTHLADPPR